MNGIHVWPVVPPSLNHPVQVREYPRTHLGRMQLAIRQAENSCARGESHISAEPVTAYAVVLGQNELPPKRRPRNPIFVVDVLGDILAVNISEIANDITMLTNTLGKFDA